MTTEERLEKLELELARTKRNSRRLILGGMGLFLGLSALLVAGRTTTSTVYAQEKTNDKTVIRANAFILLDEQGRERGALSMYSFGPALTLLDEKNKTRAVLSVGKEGPNLSLADEKGKPRVFLAMDEKGMGLGMFAEQGNSLTLAVIKDGPGLNLVDENGGIRVALCLDKDRPMLDLRDENGKSRAVLGSGRTTAPDGKIISYPESSLLLFGPEGKIIWQAP
ncbi:MAG: hypothetical protein GWP14_11195 [Actinobacteria bacterium]|nr:hypothetical protein [Actinomycetota bacterium]